MCQTDRNRSLRRLRQRLQGCALAACYFGAAPKNLSGSAAKQLPRRKPEQPLERRNKRRRRVVPARKRCGRNTDPLLQRIERAQQSGPLPPAAKAQAGLALEQAHQGLFGHAQARRPIAQRDHQAGLFNQFGAQRQQARMPRQRQGKTDLWQMCQRVEQYRDKEYIALRRRICFALRVRNHAPRGLG